MKKRELKSFPGLIQGLRLLSAMPVVLMLMTGCGGGTMEKTEEKPIMASAQTVETQKVAYGPIKPTGRTSKRSGNKAKVASSSFTVNPTENFNGFNPEVWNSRSSWTECNCSNNQSGPPPKIVNWNP